MKANFGELRMEFYLTTQKNENKLFAFIWERSIAEGACVGVSGPVGGDGDTERQRG